VAAFTAIDAAKLAGIPFLRLPAWFGPKRLWPAFARVLSPLAVAISAGPEDHRRGRATEAWARPPELSGMTILRDMAAEGILGFCRR
jgi:hypothetical protein